MVTTEQILASYDNIEGGKTAKGFAPHSQGRQIYCDWFLAEAGESYTTRKGVVHSGHTPMRIRGLYLLEKALNARNRTAMKAFKDYELTGDKA